MNLKDLLRKATLLKTLLLNSTELLINVDADTCASISEVSSPVHDNMCYVSEIPEVR